MGFNRRVPEDSGYRAYVEASSDLVNWQPIPEIAESEPGAPFETVTAIPASDPGPRLFFRIRVEPYTAAPIPDN